MSQNITLMGASYSNVPAVTLPKTGGGTATFTDTSDATLDNNAKMLSGVTAYSNGTKYTGSIASKTSSDLTASGATVTAPSGYYASNATKTISSGSATPASSISGTSATVSSPSSNKIQLTQTVSNTPQVTAGYVSSGTAGNSSVSLTGACTTKGTASIYASTSDQTIGSGTFITGTQTFKAVSQTNLSAENIKDGTTISISNGSTNIWSVTGTYSGGGGGSSKNVQIVQGTTRTNSSTLTAIGAELTVSTTGTYDVYWSGVRTNTSSSYSWGTQLYIDGVAHGSENTTWSNNVQNNHLSNVSLTANQKLRVRGRETRGTSYYVYAPTLVIIEA